MARRSRRPEPGFQGRDNTELQRWLIRLDEKGVTHSGIIDIGFGPTVVFRDPDNIQLEFFVHGNVGEQQLSQADSGEARQALCEAVAADERASSRN